MTATFVGRARGHLRLAARARILIGLGLIGLGLSDCAPSSPFQSGYANGCAIGRRDANSGYDSSVPGGQESDAYKSEPDYRASWDQGHERCYEVEHRAPRVIPGR